MRVADGSYPTPVPHELSEALGEVCASRWIYLPDTSATVSIVAPSGRWMQVYASNPSAADLEQIGFVLDEGPHLEAQAKGIPVVIDHVTDDSSAHSSRRYSQAAAEHGVRSIVALPLQDDGLVIGALTLFSNISLRLHEHQLTVALRMANAASEVVAEWLNREGISYRPLSSRPEDLYDYQVEIPQASGMVMAQLGISISDAMIRLRAHAYANDLSVAEVARRVVGRNLRFGAERSTA
jgi:GAF domain-containing protein